MIFPWDSEIHSCPICGEISYYDSDWRNKTIPYKSNANRFSYAWISNTVSQEMEECAAESPKSLHFLCVLKYHNTPCFIDFITEAKKYADYEQ